jgi:predicted SprT family Zn-dependent metalloprotease
MSNNLLSAYARPHVIFDARNAQHRKWAHRFLKDRNWSGCPVQFVLFNGDDNVVSLINRELTRYYLSKEFGRIPLDHQDRNYQKWVDELPSIEYTKK